MAFEYETLYFDRECTKPAVVNGKAVADIPMRTKLYRSFNQQVENEPLRQTKCPRCGSTNVTDSSQSLDCQDCGKSW